MRKLKNKFTFYKQLDQMDCGPTCLRMVAKYYGKNISIESLRNKAQVNRDGTSIFGISEAAEKIGLRTIGCKLTIDQLLEDAPIPCIVHWKQNHFVIVIGSVIGKKITIADPREGIINVGNDEFLNSWISSNDAGISKGIALLLEPTEAFYQIEEEKERKSNWFLLLRYLLSYKAQLFQLAVALFLGSIFQLIFPILTQSIVDTGINSQNLNFIEIVLLAQFFLFFSQTVIEFIRGRILLFISTHINLTILSEFWIKLMRLPMQFFDTKNIGDILQRISDHRRIESFITGVALQTLFSVFNLILFSLVLFYYSVLLFFIFFSKHYALHNMGESFP